mmetsp:Transcript_2007/g.3706  ORF Transcript_2007/g.3706 Transcript_2007/m.3706 type:complete len:209 (-) Transcript_2007:397-1023(-)
MAQVFHNSLPVGIVASIRSVKPLHCTVPRFTLELDGSVWIRADQFVGVSPSDVQKHVVHHVLVDVRRVSLPGTEAEVPHATPLVLEEQLRSHFRVPFGSLQQRLHFLFGVQWLLIQELENDLTVLRVSRVLDFPGLPCFSEKDLLGLHGSFHAASINGQDVAGRNVGLPADCRAQVLHCALGARGQCKIRDAHPHILKQRPSGRLGRA